jgi:hypothetical protein
LTDKSKKSKLHQGGEKTMRINHGVLKELSTKTGKSLSLISDIAATRKRPGRNMAETLAKASGVNEIIWLYGTADEIKQALNDAYSKKYAA